MIDNSKYTTYKEIIARLSSLIKLKNINPADIMAWSIECETEWIGDFPSLISYNKVKLQVKDKMARIPPYCARLLDVYDDPEKSNSHVNYYNNGSYVILGSEYTKDHVYINFLGIALDEDGIPLIKKGHEEACIRHCIVNAYYEDFINGRIAAVVYGEMKEERNLQVQAAVQSYDNISRKDLAEISAIHMNMLPHIRFDSHVHTGIGG
jgi:hypothetical protein